MSNRHSARSLWARRRFWLALTLSLGLHLIFLPDLGLETDEKATRVILATLRTETPERANNDDQRGERSTPTKPLSTPSKPEPVKEVEPAREAATTTASRTPEKVTTTARTEATQIPGTPQRTKQPEPVLVPEKPATTTAPSPSTTEARFAGDDQRFSDPVEQKYYERLIAHLSQKLPAHPDGIQGNVRLQITIQYGAVITAVEVIVSSGNPATDEWARRAVLATSPVPAVPSDLKQPYFFRPTLRLND
jgi:protein TonB